MSDNNVIRFQKNVDDKLLCTYFLIFDFHLTVTKEKQQDIDTTLSLLNISSVIFTFERLKVLKRI